MFAVTGAGSTIVRELARLTGETPQRIEGNLEDPGTSLEITLRPDPEGVCRVVLAAGVLWGRAVETLQQVEAIQCIAVNLLAPVRIADMLLNKCERPLRICVVGSQSSVRGSFDALYAWTKAALDAYVKGRVVRPGHRLCLVRPPIIRDSGMTLRRADYPDVIYRRPSCRAADVAGAIQRLLWGPVLDWHCGTLHDIDPTPIGPEERFE